MASAISSTSFDESNRLSGRAGSSDDRFEIPNRAGVHAADTVRDSRSTADGFPQQSVNENQREVTQSAARACSNRGTPERADLADHPLLEP